MSARRIAVPGYGYVCLGVASRCRRRTLLVLDALRRDFVTFIGAGRAMRSAPAPQDVV